MNLIFIIFASLLLYAYGTSTVKNKTKLKKKGSTLRLARISTRIMGGFRTTITDVGGFLVALMDDGDFFCGGSLVTDLFVITAAHCLATRMSRIGDITVYGGISSLKDTVKGIRVKKAVIPEIYNAKSSNIDVAVLKLKSRMVGNSIRNIRLCSVPLQTGDIVKVSGWGFSTNNEDNQNIRSEVRTVEVPVLNHKKCKRTYMDVNVITKYMICAGVLGNKDACQFDSGGPMVYNGQLCGIVSFGVGCADSTYPGVYTDIFAVLPWIKKTVSKL